MIGDSMKKNTKKVSIQSRRRLFFLRPLCLFSVFFLLVTIASNSYRLYQLNIEKEKKEQEYIKLQEDSEYLKNEITKLNNPEEIAKFAREKYLYSKDGELIVKINEKEKEKKEIETKITEKTSNRKYLIIVASTIFIIYVVFSLVRKKDSE